LAELNSSCQEIETLNKKIKQLKAQKKDFTTIIQHKINEIESLRRETVEMKSDLLEKVERISLQYQSEIKQASMLIGTQVVVDPVPSRQLLEAQEEVHKLGIMLCSKEKQIESQIEREIELKNNIREMHQRYTESIARINEQSKPSAIPQVTVSQDVSEAVKEMRAMKEHFSKLLEKAISQNATVDTQSVISRKEMEELRRKLELAQIELTLDPSGNKELSKELQTSVQRLEKQKVMLTEEIKCLNQELATLRVVAEERSFEKKRFETKIAELVENQEVREDKYKKLKKQLFKLKNKEYHYVKEQSSLELRLAKLLDQNQELALKVQSLEHNNKMKDGKCFRLSVDLAGTSKEHELLVQQHSKAISRLSINKDGSNDKLKEMESVVEQLRRENELLKLIKPNSPTMSKTDVIDEEALGGEKSAQVVKKRMPLQNNNGVANSQLRVPVKKATQINTTAEGKENVVVTLR